MSRGQSTVLSELLRILQADWGIVMEQHPLLGSRQSGIIQVNYSVLVSQHGCFIVLLLDHNAIRNKRGVYDVPPIEMNIPHYLCGSWRR